MYMARQVRKTRFLISFLVFGAAVAGAGEVYHWVDEDGVAHFSQLPPPAAAAGEFEKREMAASTPDDYDPREDEYSVLNQAERIHAEWSALEEERRARRQSRPETPAVRPAEGPYEERYEEGYEGWRYGREYPYPVVLPHRPPIRPGHRIRGYQYRQLDDAGLWDESPAYSINSTGHRQRVDASQDLPLPRRSAPEKP
jgi:hypothetical protein